MNTFANAVIGLVALLHAYFLVLEMFLLDKPAGLRTFGHTLAANQSSTTAFSQRGF